jgi:hypothetical protein
MHGLTLALAVWGVVAPLVGIFLGNYLTKSWQREQWLKDCRKEECRELLTALAKAHMKLAFLKLQESQLTPEVHAQIIEAMESASITLHDRIYIAEDVKQKKLYGLWNTATRKFQENHDQASFSEVYAQISGLIVSIATRDNPTWFRRFVDWVDNGDV